MHSLAPHGRCVSRTVLFRFVFSSAALRVIELYHSKVVEVLPLTSKQIHDSKLDEIMIETIKLSSIISVLYFKFPKKFQVIIKLGVLRSISMMLPRQGKV